MPPRILICYSNPTDTTPLRLDVEHAEIEAAVREFCGDSGVLKRVHATRKQDLVSELTSQKYEILQFSGHGSDKGIFLEKSGRSGAELLDPESLREILSIAPPSLRAVILTCCYSASYCDEIAPHVPYVISVVGPAADKAAIQFSRLFFSHYLRLNGSVEAASRLARLSLGGDEDISIKVSRRGLVGNVSSLVIQATLDANVIVINLTPISTFLNQLDASTREEFLRAISTNMKAHFSLFHTAMDRVAIPFGEYVGIFTWQNELDPIVCEQVFVVSERVTEEQFDSIARLVSRYTRLARQRYRTRHETEYPGKEHSTSFSLKEFHEAARDFFDGHRGEILREFSPNSFKVAAGIIRANLVEADSSQANSDLSQAIMHMETALMAFHNFILQLLKKVSA